MDRRTTAFNGRVASKDLRGQVDAEIYVEGVSRQIGVPIADLLQNPGGRRERQLLYGSSVHVFDRIDNWIYLQSDADQYVGYVDEKAISVNVETPTHFVAALAGHTYSEPDIKSRELAPIYFGAKIAVASHMPNFYETTDGAYIPKPQLRRLENLFSNPVTVGQMFFGAPYLWGGNSVAGIDCSGLVQAAHLACGIDCPADSDQQERQLGDEIESDAPIERGDLFFWNGHVALAVDGETCIHANAHHMAVAYEPISNAIYRIEAQGDGKVTSRRRLAAG